ncbi:MAG: GatB/YqeY domain-containing protein [Rhizobiales bacterium]|nr:GatB/YqeY domain-containing protein [Hyphomicrobiales bacterium]
MGQSLRDKVNAELKEAMKAQDKRRISTLRLVNAAFKDRDIQNRGTGKDEAPKEGDLQAILSTMIKQRRQSAEAYDEGGRPELADGERAEIAIIEKFLPEQMSDDDTRAAVSEVIGELDCSGLKDMGRVMAALKERHAGQMDFAQASKMVKELLG